MFFPSSGGVGCVSLSIFLTSYRMCGIISYIGGRQTAGKLAVAGLLKLEYRGYDSFGFAEFFEGGYRITKRVGKVSDFVVKDFSFAKSNLVAAHTRWATHGGVSEVNAHPIASHDGRVVVVHNGIIENYIALKKQLGKKGVKFVTQTDTEVLPNMIAQYLKKDSLEVAVQKAVKHFHGRYAFVALCAGTRQLVAARNGSPLILGVEVPEIATDKVQTKVAAKGFFVGSDIQAFLSSTQEVVYLDDGEMVTIAPESKDAGKMVAHFARLSGEGIGKRVLTLNVAAEKDDRGGYTHFMLKEIMEQKETLARAVAQDDAVIEQVAGRIRKAFGTFLVGCGTAGKVCMASEYLFARIAKKHVNVVFGSEFDSHEPFLKSQSLMIAVSQSGETIDILDAMQVAKRKKAKVAALVNVVSSTVARQADMVLPVNAGPEKAVASTKATTAQLAILTLLAYAVDGRLAEGKKVLLDAASEINDFLNPRYSKHIAEIAKRIAKEENMYIIGKGENYPMALEAAIKIQEVSYIHAEGFAAGELKHGPLALISKGTPLIAFVPSEEGARQAVLSNAMEVKARGGRIIGIATEKDPVFDEWIRVPEAGDAQAIVNIIPVQLLAYHLAILRKNNPDRPRNLAKSVTVK